MPVRFDRETIERFRGLPPRDAFEEARKAVYLAGSVGSEDFLDCFGQLVEEGVLTWDQIEGFDS